MRPRVEMMAVLAGSAMLMAGCAIGAGVTAQRLHLHPAAAPALAITGVGVEPKMLDLARASTEPAVVVRYRLSRAASVSLDIVDAAGHVVRRMETAAQDAGPWQAAWNGRDETGRVVPSGVYRYVLQARASDGTQATHDLSAATGGEELEPRDFTFDRATGRLRWLMPRAGRARLRIGIEGFPHLRTLLDWEPMEAGEQQLTWDGLDASGLIRAIDHPNLMVKLSAYALPDNTIIVRGSSSDADAVASSPMPATYPSEHAAGRGYLHARHPREGCHEAKLAIQFHDGTRYDDQRRPRLSGMVPVRVTLEARDASSLTNERFEVALYEDLQFLFEEEESLNPFTFLWDTTRLTPGAHLLTVNVLGYEDHYGVVTQPIVIEAPATS